jgi:hypothetical protein
MIFLGIVVWVRCQATVVDDHVLEAKITVTLQVLTVDHQTRLGRNAYSFDSQALNFSLM